MPNTVLPMGVLYLASYLGTHGHSVKIIDIARTRQDEATTLAEVGEFAPDVIGISGIITAYLFVRSLTKTLKKAFPRIPVIVGGHITIDNIEQLILDVGCDYVVVGYGEKPLLYFLDFLEGKRKREDVPQLSYLKDGAIMRNEGHIFFDNIDDMQFPAYDKVDMQYYLTAIPNNLKLAIYLAKTGKKAPPMRFAPVIGALGCTDRCAFCIHEFEYRGFRVHSTGYVMRNIEILYKDYGARIFGMGEDLFLYNPKQAREFSAMMTNNFPDAYFSCSIRADYVTHELLEALEGSNCYYLAYGFESGDDTILKILGKRMSRSTNIKAYQLISDTAITPACSFMVGTPGETRDTLRNTINAIKEAGITDSAVFFTTPYPGSRLFRWCTEQGLIKNTVRYLEIVANRDAMVLTINFTKYPDIVVKLMRMMVLKELDKNLFRAGKASKLAPYKFVMIHIITPLVYETYFVLRKICGLLFARFRDESTRIVLNDKGTVSISEDLKR